MKIGFILGSIPPPVFIENFIDEISRNKYTIYLYGKVVDKNFTFSNKNIILRKIPQKKIMILFYFIYYFIRLLLNNPSTASKLTSRIWSRSINLSDFIYRALKVMPPFFDNLHIFHIQWAKTLVEYPEFIENLKCPVVLSLRGAHINYSPLNDINLVRGYKKYFPMVAAFHAVSDAIAKVSKIYGTDPNKITVIRPAVKKELLKNRYKKNTSNNILNIISVGRCHWKKGYTFALDAMRKLKAKEINFHYTIIAGGSDDENIYYQIQEQKLNQHVSLIAGLPHKQIINKIVESDLFLLPSLEEGISNAVLESMALSIPIITTDCGGMKEVIKHNYNGFIVPVRDTNSMVGSIEYFANLDEKNKIRIINNAKNTIINHHLLKDQINSFEILYKKLK